MATATDQLRRSLRENAPEFGIELAPDRLERLGQYYELILRWNPRLHLVAPCSPREFAVRHILESLMLLKHLPMNARVADIGSGSGLPIIPCLLLRDDLAATLIESSAKKVVFLREVLRVANSRSRVRLIAERFEDVAAPEVSFVTCRALDKLSEHLPTLIQWATREATFLFFAGGSIRQQIESLLPHVTNEQVPGSEKRFLIIARRSD